MKGLSAQCRKLVNDAGVRIAQTRRPSWHVAWAERILTALFGDTDDFLYKTDQHGNKTPKPRLVELRSFLACCDVESEEQSEHFNCVVGWVHWCYLEECSSTDGSCVGDRCCEDDDMSLQKTNNSVHEFALGRIWEVGCCSRWTHIEKLKKRFLITCIGNNILIKSLVAHQMTCHLDASMITALEKVLLADKGDFSSRTKLKLLRFAGLYADQRQAYCLP